MSKRVVINKTKMAYSDIGKYLKQCRVAIEASQKDIAKEIGYTSSQILSNIECGKQNVTVKKLKKVVKAYKADPNQIFNLMVENNKKKLAKELSIKL